MKSEEKLHKGCNLEKKFLEAKLKAGILKQLRLDGLITEKQMEQAMKSLGGSV